jgi:hypothetical protein
MSSLSTLPQERAKPTYPPLGDRAILTEDKEPLTGSLNLLKEPDVLADHRQLRRRDGPQILVPLGVAHDAPVGRYQVKGVGHSSSELEDSARQRDAPGGRKKAARVALERVPAADGCKRPGSRGIRCKQIGPRVCVDPIEKLAMGRRPTFDPALVGEASASRVDACGLPGDVPPARRRPTGGLPIRALPRCAPRGQPWRPR